MMALGPDPQDFVHVLRLGLEERIKEIVAEETDATITKVRERIAGEVDRIALNILSQYKVYERENEIVITVKKEL